MRQIRLMGWFGSIHVRTRSVERVVAALQLLKLHECFVGKSGADWVGVFDKRCEEGVGANLEELARDLSSALSGDYVLAVLQGEEGFCYWLYLSGKQLDKHPRGKIGGLLFMRRAILDLCPDNHGKDRVRTLLDPKTIIVAPADLRMTEEELRAAIAKSKAKGRPTAEQRNKMAERRRVYHTDRFGVEMLSKIIGIEHFWQLYSDFSPYDLPPTFVRVE